MVAGGRADDTGHEQDDRARHRRVRRQSREDGLVLIRRSWSSNESRLLKHLTLSRLAHAAPATTVNPLWSLPASIASATNCRIIHDQKKVAWTRSVPRWSRTRNNASIGLWRPRGDGQLIRKVENGQEARSRGRKSSAKKLVPPQQRKTQHGRYRQEQDVCKVERLGGGHQGDRRCRSFSCADRRKAAKKKTKSGYGDQGDRKAASKKRVIRWGECLPPHPVCVRTST